MCCCRANPERGVRYLYRHSPARITGKALLRHYRHLADSRGWRRRPQSTIARKISGGHVRKRMRYHYYRPTKAHAKCMTPTQQLHHAHGPVCVPTTTRLYRRITHQPARRLLRPLLPKQLLHYYSNTLPTPHLQLAPTPAASHMMTTTTALDDSTQTASCLQLP